MAACPPAVRCCLLRLQLMQPVAPSSGMCTVHVAQAKLGLTAEQRAQALGMQQQLLGQVHSLWQRMQALTLQHQVGGCSQLIGELLSLVVWWISAAVSCSAVHKQPTQPLRCMLPACARVASLQQCCCH